jgi:hypothetical protein
MMMHIGLFPFAVAWMNLSTNGTTLQNSKRFGAPVKEPTTKESTIKHPAKGKKSLVRRVAKRTFDVPADDDQSVKQGQPIAKLVPIDCQVALSQAEAAFEQAKARLVQSQAQLIQAVAQLKEAQAKAAKAQ